MKPAPQRETAPLQRSRFDGENTEKQFTHVDSRGSGARTQDQQLRDLERACIHEAAHWAVARHFGIYSFFNVWPNERGGKYEKHFIGHTQLCVNEGMPPDVLRMIGLAGTVAEHLLNDRDSKAWMVFESIELDADALSETDAKLAGHFTEDDLGDCLGVVRRHWGLITSEARLCALNFDRQALEGLQ